MKSNDYKHGKKKTYLSDKQLREVKMAGMTGFFGSKTAEDFIKSRIGFLAEGCTFDYMPFHEDIRAGRSQFARYDIMCKHKDGELIVHYKVNFDSNGRFVPDSVVDNTKALQLMKD